VAADAAGLCADAGAESGLDHAVCDRVGARLQAWAAAGATSPEYADEVNAVQAIGSATSTTRTDYQTGSARFWASTATVFWNKAAATASRNRNLTLSDNARLCAVLNVAAADSVIVCWDSKL